MIQHISHENKLDGDGNPSGGSAYGVGLQIEWQKGPLRDPVSGDSVPANGCFVETIIDAAITRLEFFQDSKFKCNENKQSIKHLKLALAALNRRTEDREARGVEGTHQL